MWSPFKQRHWGVSDSIVWSGIWQGQPVVVKMAFPSERKEDNSLEIERMVYAQIRDELSKESPHLLPALRIGRCSARILFRMGLGTSSCLEAEGGTGN
jgi:hypothetical protein